MPSWENPLAMLLLGQAGQGNDEEERRRREQERVLGPQLDPLANLPPGAVPPLPAAPAPGQEGDPLGTVKRAAAAHSCRACAAPAQQAPPPIPATPAADIPHLRPIYPQPTDPGRFYRPLPLGYEVPRVNISNYGRFVSPDAI